MTVNQLEHQRQPQIMSCTLIQQAKDNEQEAALAPHLATPSTLSTPINASATTMVFSAAKIGARG